MVAFTPASFSRPRAPATYHMTYPGSVTIRQVYTRLAATIAPGRRFVFFRDEEEFMRVAAVGPRSLCVLDSAKLARVGLSLPPAEPKLGNAMRAWLQPAAARP